MTAAKQVRQAVAEQLQATHTVLCQGKKNMQKTKGTAFLPGEQGRQSGAPILVSKQIH